MLYNSITVLKIHAIWFNYRPENSCYIISYMGRSQWPCGLSLRSAVARLLTLWVRIPPEAWECMSFECCVLSGRGLCDELINRLEESYRLWCVFMCDIETSRMRGRGPCWAAAPQEKQSDILTFRLKIHTNVKHYYWYYYSIIKLAQLIILLFRSYKQNYDERFCRTKF